MKNIKQIRNLIVGYSVMLLLFIGMSMLSYRYFENNLVEQEKDKLSITASTAASNVETYMNALMDKLDSTFYVSQFLVDEDFSDALTSFINENSNEQITFEFIQDKSVIDSQTNLQGWQVNQDEKYTILTLEKNIQGQGVLLQHINMNEIYDSLLAPIQLGKYGYATCKDASGIIIMHNSPDQIGLDSNEGRKNNYQDINQEEIESLLEKQYSYEGGCTLIKSYWWNHMELGLVKKFIAYAPTMIDNQPFIVNVVTGYDEVTKPLFQYASLLVVISLFSFMLFSIMGIIYLKKEKEKDLLTQKVEYLTLLHDANEKLNRQQIELERNNRIQTLGVLASSIQHQLKNMLTPILMYSELLQRKLSDNPDLKDIADELVNDVELCADMSNSLLNYSKQNKEKKQMSYSCNSCIYTVVKMIENTIPNNIQLVTNIAQGELIGYGDENAIIQIVLNLATNAVQAMKNGGTLKITLKKENNYAVILVNDNGTGMSEETISQIFKPFYTTKSEDEGTGLGLSVVSKLVDEQGIEILIQSKLHEGTTFTLKVKTNLNKN